jgi:hypothetical protein
MFLQNRRNVILLIGIVMIVIAVINLGGVFGVFQGVGQDIIEPTEVEALPPAQAALAGASGLTTPGGLAKMIVSVLLIVVALGLLTGQRWELGAMFLLGADVMLKLLNIAGNLAVGLPVVVVIPLIIMISDSMLIYALFRRRGARSAASA